MSKITHDTVEAFLLKTIKKKDIYTMAAHFFVAAMVYLEKWGEWVDLQEECKKEEWLELLTDNFMGLVHRMALNNTEKLQVIKKHENNSDG